jgi:hypothetical protein
VEVAITYVKIVRTEVGKGSVSTTFVHGLVGPKKQNIIRQLLTHASKGRKFNLHFTTAIRATDRRGLPIHLIFLRFSFSVKICYTVERINFMI